MIENYEYLDYIIDHFVSEGIDDFEFTLKEIVDDVRLELSKRYDIHACDSENYHYRGLCDESCNMIDYILSNISVRMFKNIGIIHRHGEQKHTSRIESKHWIFQHSWLIVVYDNEKWYVDATCQQFDWLYDNIPNYYISKEPPEWFYDDRDNPIWNGWTKTINSHIRIPITLASGWKVEDGIIEYIQYKIFGRISDYIRRRK